MSNCKKYGVYKFVDKNDWKTFLSTSMFIDKGEKVVDIGAGGGKVIKLLEKFHSCKVTALDVENQLNVPINDYHLFDGKKIPFSNKSFDTVLISYVFHHVDKKLKENFLLECKRVAKKKIIMHEDVPCNAVDRFLTKLHGWEFKKRTGIQSEPSFLSIKGFKELFNKLNLTLEHIVKFPRFAREFYYPVKRLMFVLKV